MHEIHAPALRGAPPGPAAALGAARCAYAVGRACGPASRRADRAGVRAYDSRPRFSAPQAASDAVKAVEPIEPAYALTIHAQPSRRNSMCLSSVRSATQTLQPPVF